MFDTPDLIPLCLAPWIGLGVGALVFILVFIGAKRWSRVRWYVAVATGIVVVPLICYASFMLRIGEGDPTPWFEPTAKDVIGTWHLDSGTVSHLSIFNGYSTPLHRLEFEGDGTFTIWNAPNFWITLADAGGDDQTEFNAQGRWRIVTRFNLPFVLLMFE